MPGCGSASAFEPGGAGWAQSSPHSSCHRLTEEELPCAIPLFQFAGSPSHAFRPKNSVSIFHRSPLGESKVTFTIMCRRQCPDKNCASERNGFSSKPSRWLRGHDSGASECEHTSFRHLSLERTPMPILPDHQDDHRRCSNP